MLPPYPKTISAPLGWLIFIDATNKFSVLKKWSIARNIKCFIMNHYQIKRFLPILFTYPFQTYAIVRIYFEAGIYAQICLKVSYF